MSGKALSLKRQRFVAEYLVDLNATQAAIRAGYSAKTAQEQGARLLCNVMVRAAIDAGFEQKRQQLGIDSAQVLREIATLAYSDIGDILDFTGDVPRLKRPADIPAHARRCISGIKVKRHLERTGDVDEKGRPIMEEVEVVEFRLWDKGAKLQDLMKHLGLMVEKHEHDHEHSGVFVVEVEKDGGRGHGPSPNGGNGKAGGSPHSPAGGGGPAVPVNGNGSSH